MSFDTKLVSALHEGALNVPGEEADREPKV